MSTSSPVSCASNSPASFCQCALHLSYDAADTIRARGYTVLSKVADTLQGSIVHVCRNDHHFIIKLADKSLMKRGVCLKNGKTYNVQEDILKEAQILRHLSQYNPPNSLATFVDWFTDRYNVFLVMQHAGDSLFTCVKHCHTLLQRGLLDVDIWQSFCKIAMRQMIEVVDFLHNTMHTVHFDISLENFAISNLKVCVDSTSGKVESISTDFQIKIIDFGLAEVFATQEDDISNINYSCVKFVGKVNYECPEIYAHEMFDARDADCWSLAATWFMMLIGSPPFGRPCEDDAAFSIVMDGHLEGMLKQWDRLSFITNDQLDLFRKMFVKSPRNRLNLQQMKRHPCLL